MFEAMLAALTLNLTAADAASQTPAEPATEEIAPVDVTAPPRPAAKSHQQIIAERWSPHIITCRVVFVQGIGIARRECATNRAWEIEGQRVRHEFMQEQWRLSR